MSEFLDSFGEVEFARLIDDVERAIGCGDQVVRSGRGVVVGRLGVSATST
jgi:hypothetical protein